MLLCSLLACACWRLWLAVDSLQSNSESALLAIPFTVILPLVLALALMLQQSTLTREGLLMRVGAIVHLLLIIVLPRFALYLALGFPFVALSVEWFETQAPAAWRDRLGRALIRC